MDKKSKTEYTQNKKGFGKPMLLPAVSGYSSRKEWEAAAWRKILKSKELLDLLITSHERQDLVRRVAAMESLSHGKSYKEIGDELWLSPQTISGIKKALKEKGYRSYLERSKTERKKKKFSSGPIRNRREFRGRPKRTKYGIIYLPQ